MAVGKMDIVKGRRGVSTICGGRSDVHGIGRLSRCIDTDRHGFANSA